MNVLISLFLPQTLTNLFWKERYISKFYFYFKETQMSRKREIEYCIVIVSIVKSISFHNFEKSLAKFGRGKREMCLLHNKHSSCMS